MFIITKESLAENETHARENRVKSLKEKDTSDDIVNHTQTFSNTRGSPSLSLSFPGNYHTVGGFRQMLTNLFSNEIKILSHR